MKDAGGNLTLVQEYAEELVEEQGCIVLFGGHNPAERAVLTEVSLCVVSIYRSNQ